MQARIEPSDQEIEQFEKDIRDLYFRVLGTLSIPEQKEAGIPSIPLLFSPTTGGHFQRYLEKTAFMPDPFIAALKLKNMCETFLSTFDEKAHKKAPKKMRETRIERMNHAINEIRQILTTHCEITTQTGSWADNEAKDDKAPLNISDDLRQKAIGWKLQQFLTVETVFSEGINYLFQTNQIPQFVKKIGAEDLTFSYNQDAIDIAIYRALETIQECRKIMPTLKSKLSNKAENDFFEKLEEKLIRYSHLSSPTAFSKKEKKLHRLFNDFKGKVKHAKNLTNAESALLGKLEFCLFCTMTHTRKSEQFNPTALSLSKSSKKHRKDSNASKDSDSSAESTHSNSRNAKSHNKTPSTMSAISEDSNHSTVSIMNTFSPRTTSNSVSTSTRSLTPSKASSSMASSSSTPEKQKLTPTKLSPAKTVIERPSTPNAKKTSRGLHDLFASSTSKPPQKTTRSQSHDLGRPSSASVDETLISSLMSQTPGGDGGVGSSSPVNKKKK